MPAGYRTRKSRPRSSRGGALRRSRFRVTLLPQGPLLLILSAVVLFILTLFGVGLGLRRMHRLQTPADEVHFAPTPDGWRLALHRYLPPGGVVGPTGAAVRGASGPRAREPLILCHGMLATRFAVDLDERHSLARYLRRAGFDVWVLELRGHGRSRRAATGGLRPFDWTVDHYIREDLPAAVAYVRGATGATSVQWVGHSLGGMILYAACAVGVATSIRSAVMIDVPTNFGDDRRAGWIGRTYIRLVPVVPPALVIPFTLVLSLISPALLLPKYGIRDRRTMLRIVSNGIIDWGCSRAARQLVDLVLKRRFASADGRINYEDGVARIHFPVLQLAAVNRISPETVVRSLIDRAPVDDKTYVRLGRAEGFSEDYNHFTILLGERAPQEVFPIVADFLRRTSSPLP